MEIALDARHPRTLRNLVRARFTGILLAVCTLYVQLAILLPNGWLAEVMRCFQVTLSAVVLMGYWRSASACFFVVGRWPQKQNVIALGIEISWFAIFCNSTWALLYRLSGQPGWMINNDYYTAWTAASSFAASLHIVAPNMIGQSIPDLDRRRYAVMGIVGGTLLVVVGLWRPDMSDFVESIRHALEEPEWMKEGLIRLLTSPRAVLSAAF